MTVRRLLLIVSILILPALGACLRAVEISPENAVDSAGHLGNIKVETKSGILYYAQSIEEGEAGFYRLIMVKVVDDGVKSWKTELALPKASVVSIHYYENNKWLVGGTIAVTSLFIVWLYYKINTSVFD